MATRRRYDIRPLSAFCQNMMRTLLRAVGTPPFHPVPLRLGISDGRLDVRSPHRDGVRETPPVMFLPAPAHTSQVRSRIYLTTLAGNAGGTGGLMWFSGKLSMALPVFLFGFPLKQLFFRNGEDRAESMI
jgi:hypothetical protein